MPHPVPLFPRGFVFSTSPVVAPTEYVQGPLLENFYVHPWTSVEAAGDRDLFVIIIGLCVTTDPAEIEAPASTLLKALQADEAAFLNALGRYSGRYAIIFGSAEAPKVVNDATAMRSVFYSDDFTIIGSHAPIVQRAVTGSARRDRMPFQYGYPGNRTPFDRTRLLTPNTYLDVAEARVRRFWPIVAPPAREVDAVAAETLLAATVALRNVSAGRKVKMALTAGLDSRVILGVALNARLPVEAYTYGTEANTETDRLFAADLATQFGIPHTTVKRPELSKELGASLGAANYSAHHKMVVPGLIEWFNDHTAVALSGNLLEIGRDFFGPMRTQGVPEPVSPETMTNLHYRRTGLPTRERIAEYGGDRWKGESEEAFGAYIADTDYASTLGLIDPFDLFYWEHRMTAWHGTLLLERDFYGEAFIPFNSRNIFSAMLGIGREDRSNAAVFYRMLNLVDPSLLDLPVNPRSWPIRP